MRLLRHLCCLLWLLPALSAMEVLPAAAQETCFEYCTGGCPAGDEECINNCSIRCSPGGDLDETWQGNKAAPYGAIAYGQQSGAFGYAFNQPSAAKAAQVAMSYCGQNGQDCKVVINLVHACGAVATGDSGTVFIGEGSSRDAAQNTALKSCRKKDGQSCDIQVWTCSP